MAKITLSKINKPEIEKYKKGKIGFPVESIDPSLKDAKYHKQWAEKLYSLHVTHNAWMPSGTYSVIDENRSYADGKHNMEVVKDWVLGKRSKTKNDAFDNQGFDVRDSATPEVKRKAWEAIDFTPVSVLPKIWTKINEDIRSMYYEMSVNAIDSYSVRTEEHEKNRLWFYKQNKKWIETQMALVGIEPDEPDFMPENYDELELYALTGGFKVPYAISMEDLIKHTFEVSDWDKDVAEKVRKDLFSNGYALIQEVYDRELKRIKVRHVDIKYGGLQYSKKNNYKDAEHGYELQFMEISSIRQRLNMTHQEAAGLAYNFSGMYGNPQQSDWNNYNTSETENGRDYLACDFYKVPVFVFEFVDIDTENYIEFTDKHDRTLTKPYKGEIQDNEELKSSQIRYVRGGSWIVGTEHIFDWGKREYFPRDMYKKPRISFRGVRLGNTAIVEQVKPFIRGFNLAWVKAQNAIAQAVNNGLAVDIGALKNISIGKDKSFDPMELLSYYRQSSFLLYKRASSLSGFNRYNAPPIIPINNDMFRNIQSNFESMNYYMQLIEDASGISMVSTGKQADPNVAKFNMEVSLQGTNSIINSIARGQTDLQEDISTNIAYRIRTMCRTDTVVRKSYENVIGERRMKVFVDAEKSNVEYGIKIEASNIDERKQVILALLNNSITTAGDGDETGKLSPDEAIHIYDMIFQRQNLRRIGLVLGWMLRKKKREAREWKLKYIQEQNDGLAKIEQQKAENKQLDRTHEENLADKKFWADFTIKYGVPPEIALQDPSFAQNRGMGEQQNQASAMPPVMGNEFQQQEAEQEIEQEIPEEEMDLNQVM